MHEVIRPRQSFPATYSEHQEGILIHVDIAFSRTPCLISIIMGLTLIRRLGACRITSSLSQNIQVTRRAIDS